MTAEDGLALFLTAVTALPGNRSGAPVTIVLAVSGGADSLAMLWLAAAAATTLRARDVRFVVVTIDHALRPASADEAEDVAACADRLGLPHETLRRSGALGTGNLQALAREARYTLLARAANACGAAAVMTAHHQDDQIETHLLAAARKAGDRGLAAMRPCRALAPGLWLLRPFLGVPGARLKATVAAAGLEPADDPGNRDPRFDRVRLRQSLGGDDDRRPRLLQAIEAAADRRDAADDRLAEALQCSMRDGSLVIDGHGVVRILDRALGALDRDTVVDLLARLLPAVAGRPHPPLRASLERLAERLQAGEGWAATLGGACLRGQAGMITVMREYGRAGPSPVSLEASNGGMILFDGRFDVSVPANAGGVCLVPLGSLGFGTAAQRTLPVLLGMNGLPLAVPEAAVGRLGPGPGVLSFAERVTFRLCADLAVSSQAPLAEPALQRCGPSLGDSGSWSP